MTDENQTPPPRKGRQATTFKPGQKAPLSDPNVKFRMDLPRKLPENFHELSHAEQRKIILGRRMTRDEYEEAKMLYQRDGYTLRQLEQRFGFSESTFISRFKRDGIIKNQLAHLAQKAVNDRTIERLAERAEEVASRHIQITDTIQKGLMILTNQLMKTNIEAMQKGKTPAALGADNKAIKEAMAALKLAYETAHDIVSHQGRQDEEELPELRIRVMDESDVAELRRQEELEQRMLLGDLTDELDELDELDEALAEAPEASNDEDTVVEDG